MKSKGPLAGFCLLVMLAGTAWAQDEPATPPEQQPTAVEQATEEKKKMPFGLYVEVATGAATADDVDPSLVTLSTHVTSTNLSFDDQIYARAALGWQLPNDKGDFRLVFNGYNEDGYTLTSEGQQADLDPALGSHPEVLDPLLWWTLRVEDGVLTSARTPPVWTLQDDSNGNGFIDDGEQRYPGPDLNVSRSVTKDLQNRAQTIDFVYGRTWGPRRYRGRWWGGLRYFAYDGAIPATAWLNIAQPGEGFSEGAFIRLLNFRQEASGVGPTGSMEVQFKFFDDVLTLFAGAQAAFMVLDVSADTGAFFTLAESTGDIPVNVPIDARLQEELDKSSWNTMAEAGLRITLRNGLRLELAYSINGYLDAILLPTEIRIPENLQEASQGSSAIYTTQDYVLDGWRGGIAFQF